MKPQTRSSRPEVFSGKGFLKICSKFTGEHPSRSVISIKFQSNFIEITLRQGCSPVNVLHIFRAHFLENTYGGLLLPNEFSFESRGSVCIYFFKNLFNIENMSNISDCRLPPACISNKIVKICAAGRESKISHDETPVFKHLHIPRD